MALPPRCCPQLQSSLLDDRRFGKLWTTWILDSLWAEAPVRSVSYPRAPLGMGPAFCDMKHEPQAQGCWEGVAHRTAGLARLERLVRAIDVTLKPLISVACVLPAPAMWVRNDSKALCEGHSLRRFTALALAGVWPVPLTSKSCSRSFALLVQASMTDKEGSGPEGWCANCVAARIKQSAHLSSESALCQRSCVY